MNIEGLQFGGSIRPLKEVATRYKPSDLVFPTGTAFDKAMDGGIREGELLVISGETGQGKTTFCQMLTVNLSDKSIPSIWFSYEMSPYYLQQKFDDITDKNLLVYAPIKNVDGTIKFIEDQTQEAIKEFAIKAVFIDHLHYLIPLKAVTSTSLMVGGIVRELKQMAVRNNIFVILIAHTKKIYQDEELSLNSIRDSSLVSQEADYVWLIKRLPKNEKIKKKEKKEVRWSNRAKVMMAKNRRTGKLFDTQFMVENNVFVPVTNFYDEEDEELQSIYDALG